MTCHALSIGITEDNIAATALLHDLVEDTDVSIEQLPVSEPVRQAVKLLTFKVLPSETKEIAMTRYYNLIAENPIAAITKCLDRCNNVSNMAGVFSPAKMQAHCLETRKYILPLLRHAKEAYPVYTNQLFAIYYQIQSVIDAIELTLKACEK